MNLEQENPTKGLKPWLVWTVVILLGITVAVAILMVVFRSSPRPSKEDRQTSNTILPPSSQVSSHPPPAEPTRSAEAPPLLLKSIGFELDQYDPATNRAGDLEFTRKRLNFGRLWMDYGFVIPAEQTASGQAKANPQPTFILPLGTKVRSLVDGVVVRVEKLYSNDWTVMVADKPNNKWIYETEHVANPSVKVGDLVTAGQIIAEVANFNNNAPDGFGVFEIGILQGGNPPSHVCPFAYLDSSIKEAAYASIRRFYADWETYTGNPDLYDETLAVPGCASLQAIEG